MKTIYLDHQATTPTTASVIKAMNPFWSEQFGNPHSSEHIKGMFASRHIETAKQKISNTLRCEADEIFFTSGATEANNTAIHSLCNLSTTNTAKQIIISAIEHKCVIESAVYWAKIFNLDLKIVNVDEQGYVDCEHLEALLQTPTLFCSIIAAHNEIGTIQDIEKISVLTRKYDAFLHSDCAQALKTDLDSNPCELVDVASFSGHKIGGPQGIGFLFISANMQNDFSPLMFGGGQQHGLRSGTLPLPLCVGLGQAVEDLSNTNFEHLRHLRDLLFTSLRDNIPGLGLNGPPLADRHAGNLNIYIPSIENTDLIAALQPNLCVSSGSACGSGNIEPSYVLRALPTPIDISRHSIRMSVSENTTKEDINEAVRLITQIVTASTL